MFGPAILMLKSIKDANPPSAWCHAAYGMFATVLPYFEMIGKILNPAASSSGTAGQDFNVGFCDVYPSFRPANDIYTDKLTASATSGAKPPNPDIQKVVEFRDRARNGLFHVGYTKHGLIINGNESLPDIDEKSGNYHVNVYKMLLTVVEHFPSAMHRIRNDGSTLTQFLKYFDTMLAS